MGFRTWTASVALVLALSMGPAVALAADGGVNETPDTDQPQGAYQVTATVSPDEKVVTLTGAGQGFADASTVGFRVWSTENNQDDLVVHGAKRNTDGTWTALVYIASPTPDPQSVPYNCRIPGAVHRLYNPYDELHLYTNDVNEAANLATAGWRYEGVSWITPTASETGSIPIYRLYNPYTGDHLFTSDFLEYRNLATAGWQVEGQKMVGATAGYPVYRLYNPHRETDTHLYTTDPYEYDRLAASGWEQEDVCWYGATESEDGAWSATGQARPHNDAGDYQVEAVIDNNPTAPPGALTTFTISEPSATMAVTSVDNAHGTYGVTVSNIRSASGVGKVEVPSWTTEGGQDDIVWYPASPLADGTWKATVNVENHQFGRDYITHGYLTAGNGVQRYLGALEAHLTLENYARVDGGPYEYRVSIYNPGPVSTVKMPTWSEVDGQDDIVWYDAVNQGDGWWTATIDTRNLKHAGPCFTHIYADDQYRNAVTFSIEPWQLSLSGDRELDGIITNLLDNVIGRDGDALRRAYEYVADMPYITNDEVPSGEFTQRYAKEMYYHQGGNCFRYASLFNWLARGLGFDSRVCVGGVRVSSGGYADHGWTEVFVDGDWRVFDPDMAHAYGSYDRLWWQTYDTLPFYVTLYWRAS